uniref:EamA domain-containing protein n=1 Tax=Macrostomum lignano TaxID=282301 RepID=A0A1I8JM73_9PLAT
MDTLSYQILSNLKILTTAVLFQIIMREHISRVNWLALLILFAAGVANGAGGLMEKSLSEARLHVTPVGLGMILIYCTISGLASVYT